MDLFLEILRAVFFFCIASVLLVEAVGYFWHRAVEHYGFLGETIRYRHWVHHELDYPTENLRPEQVTEYKNANSWSWYVLAAITILLVFIILPLRDAITITVGGVLYAYFVVLYFHEAFHIKGHWLFRFPWFERLVRLHDIHHFTSCNYGIVFFEMDRLFGTLREDFPHRKENIFPGFKRSA